jgi:hypothetical protein
MGNRTALHRTTASEFKRKSNVQSNSEILETLMNGSDAAYYESEEREELNEMIRWMWNQGGEGMRPFEAGGPINSDNTITTIIWHCHGCAGELVTHWRPYQPWIKPNEENFEHGPDCMFLKVKARVETAFKETCQDPFYNFYESPDDE